MKEWLVTITEQAVVIIDGLALLVIIAGTIEATVRMAIGMASRAPGPELRDIWIRYARSLVAALTFQLAADIIESAVSTSWESIGRLAAVAVIRTFLNYFLERDIAEVRERRPRDAA